MAVTFTSVPSSYSSEAGFSVTVPPSAGFAVAVRVYLATFSIVPLSVPSMRTSLKPPSLAAPTPTVACRVKPSAVVSFCCCASVSSISKRLV